MNKHKKPANELDHIRNTLTDIVATVGTAARDIKEVQKHQSEHDLRFDKHDLRFDKHDQRFDEIDKRFDQLELLIRQLIPSN
ncbi:hypothetical protein [Endozoicomonas sp.]|uniref:hypothetical protein n=1 Tax=Endozoicomonas sp. TaxID=1892382 RepID=UPI00383A8B4F